MEASLHVVGGRSSLGQNVPPETAECEFRAQSSNLRPSRPRISVGIFNARRAAMCIRFVLTCLLLTAHCARPESSPEPDSTPPPPLPLETMRLGPAVTAPRVDGCPTYGGLGASGDRCDPEGESVYLVIEELGLTHFRGETNEETRAPGWDRDGLDNRFGLEGVPHYSGCWADDFASLDGMTGGIDNQSAGLGWLVAVSPRPDPILDDLVRLPERMHRRGQYGAVLEIRNWNGTLTDECIELSVLNARLPQDAREAETLDFDEVEIAEPALRRSFGAARIERGTLRAELGAFPLHWPQLDYPSCWRAIFEAVSS